MKHFAIAAVLLVAAVVLGFLEDRWHGERSGASFVAKLAKMSFFGAALMYLLLVILGWL